jgi:hypothetical protein
MSRHFLFIRFFYYYPRSFPFKRYANLKDEALGGALEALRREELRKPANRKRAQASRKEAAEREQAWAQGGLAMPGVNRCLPWTTTPTGSPLERTETPALEEAAVPGGLPHGVTRRHAVAVFDTKEAADDAAAVLQKRVEELIEAVYDKHRWNEDETTFAVSNPWFFAVAEEELSRPEWIRAQEQITRVRGPAVGNVSLEEGLLRFYWPTLLPTLEKINSSPGPGVPPVDGPLDDDRFVRKGVLYPIPHLQWLLLKTIWNKPRGVSTSTVLRAVYGDDDDRAERRLKALANDLRNSLTKFKIPLGVSCRSEKWRLITIDTPPVA